MRALVASALGQVLGLLAVCGVAGAGLGRLMTWAAPDPRPRTFAMLVLLALATGVASARLAYLQGRANGIRSCVDLERQRQAGLRRVEPR